MLNSSSLQLLPYVSLIGLCTAVAVALVVVWTSTKGKKNSEISSIDAIDESTSKIATDLSQVEILFMQSKRDLDVKRAASVVNELIDVISEVDRRIEAISSNLDKVRGKSLRRDRIDFGKRVAKAEIDVGALERRAQAVRSRVIGLPNPENGNSAPSEKPAHV